MTTLKELEEEYREMQAHPDAFDELKSSENTVGGNPTAPGYGEKIPGNALAGMPDQYKEQAVALANEVERNAKFFDTASRSGAGGTKAGLVGLRPNGSSTAWLDQYTGTGRMKKEAPMFSENVDIKDDHIDHKARKPSVVLYEHCMDCLERVNRDSCVPVINTPIPSGTPADANSGDALRVSVETIAKWAAVGVKPLDIICYLFCTKCAMTAMNEAKRLNASGLTLIIGGQSVTAGQRYLQQRGTRISDQVFARIKLERQNPDSDCFYGDCKNWTP